MACKRCGQCCFSYSIGLEIDEDIRKWLTYHGLVIRDLADDRMGIMGHSRCEMLQFESNGMTSCAVYQQRPAICAQYLCPGAQRTEGKET